MWRGGAIRRGLAAAVLAVSLAILPGRRPADAPRPLCHGNMTDDVPRGIPQSLVPEAVRLFGLEEMPAEQVRRSTLYRCAEGRVLVCNLGANLPCGKANTSRDLPAADRMVRREPGVGFHPDVRHRARHDLSLALRWDKGGHVRRAARGRSARVHLALLEAGRCGGGPAAVNPKGRTGMSIKALARAALLVLAAVSPAMAAEPIRIGFSCEETGGSAASGTAVSADRADLGRPHQQKRRAAWDGRSSSSITTTRATRRSSPASTQSCSMSTRSIWSSPPAPITAPPRCRC